MLEHRPGEQLDPMISPRFAQIATFARLPHYRSLDDISPLGLFLGIPFDGGTTFYSGARLAPTCIRLESRLLRPYNRALDVYPFRILRAIDYGDIDIIPTNIERTLEAIEVSVREISSRNIVPFIAGGDHSITLGVLRGISRYKPILIHMDSHLDYWPAYWGGERYTHGTWVRRAIEEGLVSRVIQIGIRGPQFNKEDLEYSRESAVPIDIIFMDDIASNGIEWLVEKMLGLEGKVYISLDIDVVDPAYAPGTGTREVGGFTSREIIEVVRSLSKSNIDLVGFDVVEVCPPLDHSGITCLLAANLIYEAMSVKAHQIIKNKIV
ncbi:MAG: agmatinase [Desulfurococcales archaeon]|jgi:agmatinase|nr:agmatinase [Desulfurococcales archaeon]